MFAIVYLYWVLYCIPILMDCLFIHSIQSNFMGWGRGKPLGLKASINLSNVHWHFQKKLEVSEIWTGRILLKTAPSVGFCHTVLPSELIYRPDLMECHLI